VGENAAELHFEKMQFVLTENGKVSVLEPEEAAAWLEEHDLPTRVRVGDNLEVDLGFATLEEIKDARRGGLVEGRGQSV
jgi:hypothetical protein